MSYKVTLVSIRLANSYVANYTGIMTYLIVIVHLLTPENRMVIRSFIHSRVEHTDNTQLNNSKLL